MTACETLPGGALLGPPITPMTMEEEAAARKRVEATLARLNRPSPNHLPHENPIETSGHGNILESH